MFSKKSEPKVELAPLPRAFEGEAPLPFRVAPAARVYGIGDAIQLMRSLPVDQNVDLVVQVIRATLASMNVRVHDIIEDALRKVKGTEDGIAELHGRVADLERELSARRQEIVGLEEDLQETNAVKERLQLAESMANVPPLPSSSAAAVAETPSNGQFASFPHQP
jgi:hypothetical protein